jgi:hypothetical protein
MMDSAHRIVTLAVAEVLVSSNAGRDDTRSVQHWFLSFSENNPELALNNINLARHIEHTSHVAFEKHT